MRVLVTGGTGYLGSHVCVDLMEAGHEVIALDNLANSRRDVLDRIGTIVGRRPRFLCLDVQQGALLRAALRPYGFDGVIHLAGVCGAAESIRHPAEYYRTNASGTANVIEAAGGCPFVYGSSAAVYGDAGPEPIGEQRAPSPNTPYGRSKLVGEMVVRDVVGARGGAASVLRCFNPAGAHPSGRLGEDPRGAPCNLMPQVEQVAVKVRERVCIYGDDYATRDGTAVRDYVHVVDVARAHRLALEQLAGRRGFSVYNLGRGEGHSVLEMLERFEQATGESIPHWVDDARDGDIAQSRADIAHAQNDLGWVAERDIGQICTDSLRWRRFWLDCLRPSTVAAPPPLIRTRRRQSRTRSRFPRHGAGTFL